MVGYSSRGRRDTMPTSSSTSSLATVNQTSYQKDAFAAPLTPEERGKDRIEPKIVPPGFKSRWGSENERMNIPGLPTSLPSDLSLGKFNPHFSPIGKRVVYQRYYCMHRQNINHRHSYTCSRPNRKLHYSYAY